MHVKVVKDETMSYNSGVNNVNIDKEMADMAENQIMFKFAARNISIYFKSMQDVIKGAGR
jgi:flagellar basal-body rod protein FlgB